MIELFRYIEHAFVLPAATNSIDVVNESEFQSSLRAAVGNNESSDQIRELARSFLSEAFPTPVANPFTFASQYVAFRAGLLALTSDDGNAISQLVNNVFGQPPQQVIDSDSFIADKELLDDSLVAVKLVTGFDKVNATDLVSMRQTAAFLEDFASGKITDVTAKGIRATLRRPIRIPSEFVKSLTIKPDRPPPPPVPDPAGEAAAHQRTALMAEQQHLKTTYETIMGLPPDQFELRPASVKADRKPVRNAAGRSAGKEVSGGAGFGSSSEAVSATPTFLAIPKAAIERLGSDVRKTLEKANIDVAGAPVSHVISGIKRRWQDVSQQLAPYQVPAPAKVFRVGVHLFAVQDSAPTTAPATKEAL
jgi:hypothetical protein